MTITRQNTNSPRANGLVLQATKTLAVTGSSLGIGWIISRLFGGSGQAPEAKSLNQSITAISQQNPLQNAISSSVACGLGLAFGGAASITTHNPLPLALGSSLCLPCVEAKSTIPDSVFRGQTTQEGVVDGLRGFNRVLWTTAGAAAGLGGGPIDVLGGAALGETMASGIEGILGLASKSDNVRAAVERELNVVRNSVAQDPNFMIDPLAVRMGATNRILDSLADPRFTEAKHEMPYVKEYLTQTQHILTNTVEQQKAFAKTLGKLGTQHDDLRQKVETMNGDLTRTAERLGKVTQELGEVKSFSQETRGAINLLAQETKTSFASAQAQIDAVRMTGQETATLTKLLVQEAMTVSMRGFESDTKILGLEKEMRDLMSKQDLVGSMGAATKLKEAIRIEQNKRLQFDQTLEGIGHGIGLVGLIAQVSGNSKLAHQIVTVGQSVLTITKAVGALAGIGTAAGAIAAGGALAVLEPIGAIAGAVFAIFSLFGNSGPTPEEQIYEAIQVLTKNLQQMREEMHTRFDAVEKMILEHHKYTTIRFDRLEQMLEGMHKNMHYRFDHLLDVMSSFHRASMTQLGEILDTAKAIQHIAASIQSHLVAVEAKIDVKFRELYKQVAYGELSEALTYHDTFPLGNGSARLPSDLEKYFSRFVRWSTEGVTSSIMAGGSIPKNLITFENVAASVQAEGLEYHIQALASLAKFELGLKNINLKIPNPTLWVDAAESFLEFLWRTPEFPILPTFNKKVQQIRDTGVTFQQFVTALQRSPQLYQTLMTRYKNSLDKFQKSFIAFASQKVTRRAQPLTEKMMEYEATRSTPAGVNKVFTILKLRSLQQTDAQTKDPIDDFSRRLSILASPTQDYATTQRCLRAWDSLYSRSRQMEEVEQGLRKSFKELSPRGAVYEYILHHLTPDERKSIKEEMIAELGKPNSPLNIVIDQLETDSVLLKAYIQLGFHADFHESYPFRKMIHALWSKTQLSNQLRSWNTSIPEATPYIEIEDQVLPGVDDLQTDVFEKITSLNATRVTAGDLSKQPCGHPSVDQMQRTLHLFEAVFLSSPNKRAHDKSKADPADAHGDL